jgi:hypothetical protein
MRQKNADLLLENSVLVVPLSHKEPRKQMKFFRYSVALKAPIEGG